ncbi:phosphotransferase family protein [Roseixanthobacter liquoris]|uniref:phosphotransferase family protein n=1 Tax=Roseixanthobacter liquoris TaxID=3119921 RepID=UPI0037271827
MASEGPPEAGLPLDALAGYLARELEATAVVPRAAHLLKGGAIQQNWRLDLTIAGGPEAGERSYVLRKDAPSVVGSSHGRVAEFEIIKVAHAAGVTVPRPILACADASLLGTPFALMERVEGTALGPRVVKDPALGGDRPSLLRRLGAEMAKLHRVRPPHAALAFLPLPPEDFARADIADLRAALDALGAPRPALEWGLRWGEVAAPPPGDIRLIHRDFRTGNYMLDATGVTAILDWEFAGWGDPTSDLGWFCAECWRFGRPDLEAGGMGDRADLYAGYAAESGRPVDDARVRYFEVMAHIRWAIIALQQGARHASGQESSLELALTGRIADELELAILRATAPAAWEMRP